MRVIPTGGRTERVVFVAHATEAEIPELGAGSFEPLGICRGATELMWNDGAVWGKLAINPLYHGDQPHAAGVFRAWLSGEPVHRIVESLLCMILRRTPYVAVDPAWNGAYGTHDGIRSGDPARNAREVRRDLRDRASQGVREGLARDFAIVDGNVLQRLAPMVCAADRDYPKRTCLELVRRPHADGGPPIASGLDRSDALLDYLRIDAVEINRDLAALTDAIWARGHVSQDRRWFVNEHAGRVHGAVIAARKTHPDVDALAGFDRSLSEASDLAICGLAGDDPATVGAMREAAIGVAPFLPRFYRSRGLLSNIVGMADCVISPPPEPDADDVAALTGLGR
jgi:hypothetical protein